MIDKAIFSLPGVRRMLAIVLVLSIARALAVVGQALGLANAVVNLWGGAALAEQLPWLALFFACFVLRQVLVNAQTSLLDRYSRERAEEMREQLLTAVFNAGPSFVSQLGSASVAQTLLGGIEEIRIYIGLIIPKIIAVVAVPFVLLLAVFSLDWVSGVIALVCYPFIILYMVMIGHTAKDDAAKRHGIAVGISGEMGADISLTETFLRMGVDGFTVTPQALLPLRQIIRDIDLSQPAGEIPAYAPSEAMYYTSHK